METRKRIFCFFFPEVIKPAQKLGGTRVTETEDITSHCI